MKKVFLSIAPGLLKSITGSIYYVYDVYFENDKVVISWRVQFTLISEKKIFDPWEFVVVEYEEADEELKVKKGDKIVMPAISLFYLENKQGMQTLFEVLDVAFLLVGIGEVKAAAKLGARLIALLDVTLAVGNMVMSSYGAQMPEDFRKIWKELNDLYVGYAIFKLGLDGVRKGRDLVKKLREDIGKIPKGQQEDVLKELQVKEDALNDTEKVLNESPEELAKLREEIVTGNDAAGKQELLNEIDELLEKKKLEQGTQDLENKLEQERLDKERKAAEEKKKEQGDEKSKNEKDSTSITTSEELVYTSEEEALLWGASGSKFKKARKLLEDKGLIEEMKRINPELTDIEIVSIYRYTVDSTEINNFLNKISDVAEIPRLKAYEKILNSALEKLQTTNRYSGMTFRGKKLIEDIIINKYSSNLGKVITEDAFLSTSKKFSVAEDFMKRGAEGVETIFYIQSKTGVDINELSHYSKKFSDINKKYFQDQFEILFGSGKQFLVKEVLKEESGRYKIMLIEQ